MRPRFVSGIEVGGEGAAEAEEEAWGWWALERDDVGGIWGRGGRRHQVGSCVLWCGWERYAVCRYCRRNSIHTISHVRPCRSRRYQHSNSRKKEGQNLVFLCLDRVLS